MAGGSYETIPMGIFYAATGEYDEALLWNGNLLHICPNMILLFSEALAEDEELLYESTDNLPVAYASNDVNSTANLARGSLNLTESMAISNGYSWVKVDLGDPVGCGGDRAGEYPDPGCRRCCRADGQADRSRTDTGAGMGTGDRNFRSIGHLSDL